MNKMIKMERGIYKLNSLLLKKERSQQMVMLKKILVIGLRKIGVFDKMRCYKIKANYNVLIKSINKVKNNNLKRIF